MTLKSFILAGSIALWLAAVGVGQMWLLRYQAAAGPAAAAPSDWPAGAAVRPEPGRFTLLLFAHPHCPCTRASLDELSWIMARTGGKVDAYMVFVLPPGAPDGWERTDLRDAAEAIPGVRVVRDAGGREVARFGAKTSGQTLFYDPRGRLLFRGGLTAVRGHGGDSPGRRAVVAAVTDPAPGQTQLPVFGCPLLDAD